MALVAPPMVTGELAALMMPHTSLVLRADPFGTGLVGGRASLPERMFLSPAPQTVPHGRRDSFATRRKQPLLYLKVPCTKGEWRAGSLRR